jgi:glycerol-3-phosphate acyltransferase PlsX
VRPRAHHPPAHRLHHLRPLRRPSGAGRLSAGNLTRFRRVAVDLLGGDGAPGVVVGGVLAALHADPDLEVLLVGPPDVVGIENPPSRLRLVAAPQGIGMAEDPIRAVRSRPDASVVVAARLVAEHEADAFVSAGSTGATIAAAVVALGRSHGWTRPALAATLPGPRGDVLLLDVGANPRSTVEMLRQFALAGLEHVRATTALERPRVGLLNLGTEPGKGDPLRRAAAGELESAVTKAGGEYVGNVEGYAVPLGGVADVVVTDGFSGNVLLKGIEGTIEALGAAPPSGTRAGAILLGVAGVVVVGHGASSERDIAACIRLAAEARMPADEHRAAAGRDARA